MDQKKLDRISELTRLARQRALTEEETVERAALRQEYIDAYRRNLEAQLKGVRFVEPDGTVTPVVKKEDRYE